LSKKFAEAKKEIEELKEQIRRLKSGKPNIREKTSRSVVNLDELEAKN